MSWFKKKRIGPDRNLVEEFAAPRERKAPRFFVGREDIIAAVETACRRALKDPAAIEEVPGLTFLVQGAPGAGKSSLLAHLKNRWSGKDGCPMVMRLDKADLEDASETVLAIATEIVPDGAREFRQRIISSKSIMGRAGGIPEAGISTSGEREGRKATFRVLASLKPPTEWKQPLCILIGEIRNVIRDHLTCFEALHLGEHGLPIIPIHAGLADSESALTNAGLTRLESDNVRILGALALEEVHSHVKQMLDHCRIAYASGELDAVVKDIAECSEGWPQHVHTGTAALFRGLHQADCDLRAVDFAAVNRQARAYREASYRKRQSTRMKRSRDLAAAVLEVLPDAGMEEGSVVDVIRRKEASDGPEDRRLPEGMSANQFLDHLIHQGVLQPAGESMLICPIPSLRTRLIKRVPDAHKRIAVELAARKTPPGEPPPGKRRRPPSCAPLTEPTGRIRRTRTKAGRERCESLRTHDGAGVRTRQDSLGRFESGDSCKGRWEPDRERRT